MTKLEISNDSELKQAFPKVWANIPPSMMEESSILEKYVFYFRDLGVQGIIVDGENVPEKGYEFFAPWINAGPLPFVFRFKAQALINGNFSKENLEILVSKILKLIGKIKQDLRIEQIQIFIVMADLAQFLNKLNSLELFDLKCFKKLQKEQAQINLCLHEFQKKFAERLQLVLGKEANEDSKIEKLKVVFLNHPEFEYKLNLGVAFKNLLIPGMSHFNNIWDKEMFLRPLICFYATVDEKGFVFGPLDAQSLPFEPIQDYLKSLIKNLKFFGADGVEFRPRINLLTWNSFCFDSRNDQSFFATPGLEQKENLQNIYFLLKEISCGSKTSSNDLHFSALSLCLKKWGYSSGKSRIWDVPYLNINVTESLNIFGHILKDSDLLLELAQFLMEKKIGCHFYIERRLYEKEKFNIIGFFKSLGYSEIIYSDRTTQLFFDKWTSQMEPQYSFEAIDECNLEDFLMEENRIEKLLRYYGVESSIRFEGENFEYLGSENGADGHFFWRGVVKNQSYDVQNVILRNRDGFVLSELNLEAGECRLVNLENSL